MTSQELVTFIDQALNILEANKNFVTAEMLQKLEQNLAVYRYDEAFKGLLKTMLSLDDEKVNHLFTVASTVIEVEHKLIDGGTEKITKSLENLKNRPLILRTLTALI